MFSMGLLGRAITDWVGIGNLRNFKVRFTKQTWPGEQLTSKIVVTASARTTASNLVDLEVELSNQSGEVKVAGSAVAALPSR